jgi:outer membrane biosynthesis protein TonB
MMSRKRSACGPAVLWMLACVLFSASSIAAQQEESKPSEVSTVEAGNPKGYIEDVGNGHRIEIRSETQNTSAAAYLQHVLEQLKKSWLAFIPDEASNGRPAKVTAVFEIQSDGALLEGDPRIESSSGSAKLDQAAVYAIQYWRRYDRLPQGLDESRLTVHASFTYNVGTTTQVEIPPKGAPGRAPAGTVGLKTQSSEDSRSAFEGGYGVTILSDTDGVDFKPYLQRMLAALRKHWMEIMPDEARMGEKGKTSVVFTILPDGSLSAAGPTVEGGSGRGELDKAALGAINNSIPFEPLPNQFHGPYLKLQIIFLYNIRPESLGLQVPTAKN